MKNYKKLVLMACFMLVVSIIMIPVTTKAAQPGWEKLFETAISHKTNKAVFLNESYGITVGYGGECHYTLDAGNSWPKADNNSACRFGLDIVDQTLAWHCGNGTTVGFTNDSGKSWRIVGKCDFVANQISFINSTTGWVSDGYLQIAATNNAGTDWTNIKLPDGISEIGAINLLAENIGFLLNVDGSILYSTTDNGNTWQAQKTGIKGKLYAPYVRFLNHQEGYIVASNIEQRTEAVFVTVNGGATWKMESLNQKVCGGPFLSHDGRFLTLAYMNESIVVYRKKDVK
jgi:photosystem II stability/assembly factor-like uncharacterized protein